MGIMSSFPYVKLKENVGMLLSFDLLVEKRKTSKQENKQNLHENSFSRSGTPMIDGPDSQGYFTKSCIESQEPINIDDQEDCTDQVKIKLKLNLPENQVPEQYDNT